MTLLVNAVRVISKCKNPACRKTFELDVSQVRRGVKADYCTDACLIEHAPEYVCQVCGDATDPYQPGPFERMLGGMKLPMCRGCQYVSFRSCWRKRHFPDGYTALQWIQVYEAAFHNSPRRLRKLTPYRCPLCERWHNSSWDPFKVADQEYKDRILAIAAVFEEIGFDIDDARGWTNNPDGTHEVVQDDFALDDGVLAAARALNEARQW